ncbi:MAG: transposase family protein, partial [Desulfobacteraceae bacterium]|nr:transposase family protein [Desulfobacteraceae bacterium]
PSDPTGYKYLIVFNEYLTKWVEAFPLRNITASTVAQVFVESIICRYGCPRQILTDRGSNFLSNLMAEVYAICRIHKLNTTAYHPQTDGLTENFNATLVKTLANYGATTSTWPQLVPFALFAYRTSPHASTLESPYFALFGHDPRLPADNILTLPYRPYADPEDYPAAMARTLRLVWRDIKTNIATAQQQQKKYYDRKVTTTTYQVGDKVWLQSHQRDPNKIAKFQPHFIGPYRVLELTTTNSLLSNIDDPDKKPFWAHNNQLRKVRVPSSHLIPFSLQENLSSKTDTKRDPPTSTQGGERGGEGGVPIAKQHPYNLRPRK